MLCCVAGSFELAVLRMTRYYDVNQNCVVYGDTLLPMDAFLTTETVEMKLVNNVFEFAKTIAELKLTDTELGLYSALVLLQAGKEQEVLVVVLMMAPWMDGVGISFATQCAALPPV